MVSCKLYLLPLLLLQVSFLSKGHHHHDVGDDDEEDDDDVVDDGDDCDDGGGGDDGDDLYWRVGTTQLRGKIPSGTKRCEGEVIKWTLAIVTAP